uniref:PIR2-like helical domain-containing protein n=2 Tax=Triticum urartu TaxID=4572 RepID=A0A8R7TT12_TRIUA
MHGKPLRRIGEDCPDLATHKSVRQDICILLDRIHGFYESALERLPAERIPSLTTRLLKAGVCFGFLDPVSNIINTISYTPSPEDKIKEEEEIISKVRTNTKDELIFHIPLYPGTVDSMTVARRSLEGLVTFLCFQYRYLEKTEALRYLRLAGGDLLAAVGLLEQDRNRSPEEPVFNIMSPTTKIALECAALSARHPKPAVLVGVSLSLMSRTVKVSKILGAHCCLPSAAVKPLAKPLRASIDLGADRKKKRKRGELTPRNTESVEWRPGMDGTFRHTQTLKLLLLGRIHGFYLEALALLPRDGLRKLHHCSLIKGGYCYGPMDPVSNIILNTLWYGTAFPTH